MKTVVEYLQFESDCWNLAAQLTNPEDKLALELMAQAWAKVATERAKRLQKEALQRL